MWAVCGSYWAGCLGILSIYSTYSKTDTESCISYQKDELECECQVSIKWQSVHIFDPRPPLNKRICHLLVRQSQRETGNYMGKPKNFICKMECFSHSVSQEVQKKYGLSSYWVILRNVISMLLFSLELSIWFKFTF